MRFAKMHGAGNDYVYTTENVDNPSKVAIQVSDRHFGIGSDGLVLILPSDVADYKMRMFNADGSEGKMCGNAVRCVGKYVYDKKMTDKEEITLETLGGIKVINLNIEDDLVVSAKVDMGTPIFDPSKIPVQFRGGLAFDLPLEIKDRTFYVNCVSMGNPHAVIFLDKGEELTDELVLGYGPLIERHEMFPERINVEFIKVIDSENIQMRVFERGSGETLACGTGACAAVVAAKRLCFTGNSVDVSLTGGILHIDYNEGESVFMTGPSTLVFEGEIEI